MSEDSRAILERTRDFFINHKKTYLQSGGAEGHIMDFSVVGIDTLLPTLLLQTTGRRSGQPLITPLIYGIYGSEWVVVASKGGAPAHPAWFMNLREQDEVLFQVATQCFCATWRLPQGDEYKAVWDYMVRLFPPYKSYRKNAGSRVIPLILLTPVEQQPVMR